MQIFARDPVAARKAGKARYQHVTEASGMMFLSEVKKKKYPFPLYQKNNYYMAGSASGQDEANPVFLLATRAGKMSLCCPLEIDRFVLAKVGYEQSLFPSLVCRAREKKSAREKNRSAPRGSERRVPGFSLQF